MDFHDHVCWQCQTVWCHNTWQCNIRDGSDEARCPQCREPLTEEEEDGE